MLTYCLFLSTTGPAIFQYQQADAMFNAFTLNVLGLTAAIEGYNIVNGWSSTEETLAAVDGLAYLKENYVNGDLKFDPLGLKAKDAKAAKDQQTKEINNGRLAMIGVAGIVAQELVTGQAIF
jgi:Chlorophyll A-B binding protein